MKAKIKGISQELFKKIGTMTNQTIMEMEKMDVTGGEVIRAVLNAYTNLVGAFILSATDNTAEQEMIAREFSMSVFEWFKVYAEQEAKRSKSH